MRLTTNLKTLRDNVTRLKAVLNQETAFYLMIKGDAYNHGMTPCALATYKLVDGYGVATCNEGARLRRLGIDKPIIVTCPTLYDLDLAKRHDLIVEVGNFSILDNISPYSTIDVKVDTGMHRQGFYVEDMDVVMHICTSKHITIRALATHFASKDCVKMQLEQFYIYKDILSKYNLQPKTHYVATSSLGLPIDKGDIVRVGIGAYGYGIEGVSPVLTVTSRIDSIKHVKAGARIGYDGAYQADKDKWVAIIGGGYYDGMARSWVGGRVKIGPKRYPIVGRVNMDTFFVDLEGDEYKVGKEVEIVGLANRADMLSQEVGTIPYEILTSFKGNRWERSCKF